jgi:hypothetical protein
VSGGYGILLVATFLIVGAQLLLFLILMIDQISRWRFTFEELIGVLLMSFICHMPTIWIALMSREFILMEQMVSLLKETPLQTASATVTATAEAKRPELL